MGKEVMVIAGRQLYDNPKAALPVVEMVYGVEVRRVRTTTFGRVNLMGRAIDYLAFYISAILLMIRELRTGDTLVVKTDPPLLSSFALGVAKLKGARLVNWVQDVFPEVALALEVKAIPPAAARFLVWLRNASWRLAWRNIVLSEAMKKYLLGQGVKESTITVIHNWSDGKSVFPVQEDENQLRIEWGLEDKFVVGYSGNLGRAHEFKTIMDAAALMADREDIVFLFIGGGAQAEELRLQASESGMKNIVFRPYQHREMLAVSLSVPDIHIISLLPSLEGFVVPSKFYGIAAAGRPILYVGDIDAEIPRILEKESCGYAVSIGDSGGFVKYIEELSANQSECHQMGVRSRKMFDRYYDKPIAISAWANAIQAEFQE